MGGRWLAPPGSGSAGTSFSNQLSPPLKSAGPLHDIQYTVVLKVTARPGLVGKAAFFELAWRRRGWHGGGSRWAPAENVVTLSQGSRRGDNQSHN